MVDVSVAGDTVIFEVEGLHKLWSLRSRLQIPVGHILDAEVNVDQVGRWWHGFKLIGNDVPGVFAAGAFVYHGELVFWDVRHPERTIIVSLDHERYRKLIIEVDDPVATAERLRATIRSVRTGS